jgi:large subunit ribosomal protein L6
MAEKITESIEIPSEVNFDIKDNKITMSKGNINLEKSIDKDIKIKKEGNSIVLTVPTSKRKDKRKFGTAKSHIRNMIEGIEKGFQYELEVCNVHFPMTVTFDKTKKEFIIKNLLGEKCPRVVNVVGDIEVEIKMPIIKISSHNIEEAGQAAANLEKLARIRNRDRNKFQDGIFITKKPGRIYV